MEVLREEKQLCFFPVDEQSTGRTQNFSAWVFSNSWREEENSAWVKSAFFLSIQKSTMGGVCVEAWTDIPATPLPKQLTAITSLNYQQKLLTEGGWNKTKEDDTWVFPPFGSRVDKFPHILILVKIMPLSHFCHTDRSWLGSFNYWCIFTWW